MKKSEKILRLILVIVLSLFSFAFFVIGVAELGVYVADTSWTHFRPDYEKEDLAPILAKSALSEEDYETLYRQTGLTKLAIDDCLKAGRKNYIMDIQKAFFKTTKVYKTSFAPFTYLETLDANIPLAPMQDGDILVSAATRCSFFRYGHAALVVDGDCGTILELPDFTQDSGEYSATSFSDMANFILLRPKVAPEIKSQVVKNARENLIGLDYSLVVGILSKKYQENPTTSQCAHLVWTAYKRYGIDLDADGGGIVKPKDFLSDQMEVVQVYGFDLDTLWR